MEIPYTGRAIIDDRFDGMEITIPTKKNWFLIIFLSFWCCGWLVGELMVTGMFLGIGPAAFPGAFTVIWLIGWTAGGIFAASTLVWNFAGKEIITVSRGVLEIDRKWALFAKKKSYDLQEAGNFRAQEEPVIYNSFGGARPPNIFNRGNTGTIRFDYGMQTIKFGNALDEAEAGFLLQKLRAKKLIP